MQRVSLKRITLPITYYYHYYRYPSSFAYVFVRRDARARVSHAFSHSAVTFRPRRARVAGGRGTLFSAMSSAAATAACEMSKPAFDDYYYCSQSIAPHIYSIATTVCQQTSFFAKTLGLTQCAE